jgi:choline kinase
LKGIILSAGSGSRLLPLTRTMPKCLVEVGDRAILDHQLGALAAAGIDEAVVVVGYRGDQVREHLERHPAPLPVSAVLNPFWAVSSSIGSVWAARDHLGSPFCLMNGDTVFAASIIAGAVAAAPAGIGLLVEPIAVPELDDMLVIVEGAQVRAVAKTLPPERAHHRSLGVVLSTGDGGAYRAALDAVIAAPGGINAYHHDIVARLAASVGVGAIVDRHGGWQEIDRPEDIDRWTHTPPPDAL